MYGFNENEVVALMGAHTLGEANKANSGYSGPWVKGEKYYFNNNYYKKTTEHFELEREVEISHQVPKQTIECVPMFRKSRPLPL